MLPEVIESIGFVNMGGRLTSCANMILSSSPFPSTGEGSQKKSFSSGRLHVSPPENIDLMGRTALQS